MRTCFECGKENALKIIGADDASIEVECTACGEYFHLEPDGLGEGGLEWVEGMQIEQENE